MAKSGQKTIEFKSGGPRPMIFTHAPKAYVNSAQAAQSTLRLRNTNIAKHFETLAGNLNDAVANQTSKLLNSLSQDTRHSILDNAGLNHSEISASVMVAMKTDMGVPWEKLKIMSRWLKTYDICTWSGKEVIVENAPFFFEKDEKDKLEIKEVPWGYISDLPKHIFRHLEELENCNDLVNHNFIQNKEIYIKIGGDYGGGSFKMSYQIVNTINPNSSENTIVFNIFESKDLRANIKVAMARFEKQIEALQIMKYKDNSIRVFIFGDYEFLCSLYGISGASGKHCCLFCYATTNEMKLCKKERTGIESRTLENLQADFERFMKDGGIKKKAKFYNNVIVEPILRIPLNQVSLPSLHIALGVYLKFFNMFEEEAHEVDIMMAASLKNKNCLLSQPYQDYIFKQQKILNLKRCIDKLDDQIQLVNDTVAIAILNNEDCVENIQSLYIPQLNLLNETKMEKVRECNGLENELIFKKSEGPCIQQIELILQKLKVQRQAYHGICLKYQVMYHLCIFRKNLY
ncbi:uncharacterized protein LOC136090116 [Hydra vulgaris]|uniref:Uncharacterized protein LOC136090116 n=1 Tax=Hydra vulgaris TaxID=6087 RepID=A0ABM4DD19_HYDVU